MSEILATQRSEREAIDNLVERLRQRFPDLPAQDVAGVITQAHRQFTDAKVRDFVPVLVEHEAVNELKRKSRRPVRQH